MADSRKVAYAVECFLNAAGIPESKTRVSIESILVQNMILNDKLYAVYHDNIVQTYTKSEDSSTPDKVGYAYTLSGVDANKDVMIWTDGKEISALDKQAYTKNKKLVLLGAAGLALTAPGIVSASQKQSHSSGGGDSSNLSMGSNNNNNNNNNG